MLNNGGGKEIIAKLLWTCRRGKEIGAGIERGFDADEITLDCERHIWFEKKEKKCIDALGDSLPVKYIGASLTVEKQMSGSARKEVSETSLEREASGGYRMDVRRCNIITV